MHCGSDVGRDEVCEDCDWLVVGKAGALNVDDKGTLGDLQGVGFLGGGWSRLVVLDGRVHLVAGVDQVAHERSEFHGAMDVAW